MYLGWDIGIKNLAYCNIEIVVDFENQIDKEDLIQIEQKYFRIKYWGIINLVDKVGTNMIKDGSICLNNRAKLQCYYPKNTKGTECKKTAVYCLENKKDGQYQGLCANHFKRLGYSRLPDCSAKPTCYFQKDLGDGKFDNCSKKSQWMLDTHHYIGFCSQHKKKLISDFNKSENNFLKIDKTKKASSINLTQLGLALYQQMDNKKELLDVKVVLLENQPVLKNPTMKSVQMLLYSYFIMKGVKEQIDNNQEPISDIKCYMANNKTKLLDKIPEISQKNIKEQIKNIKSQYSKNKKTAILLTDFFISGKPKWETFFKTHKKKDDLADSFLMTIHYLVNNKISENK
jgi:hypothetical protein